MRYPFLIKIHNGELEKPAIFMRKHAAMLFSQLALYLVLAAAPFATWLILSDVITTWFESPRIGPAVVLALSGFELFVLLLLYSAFMDWYLDVWIVTDERIIDVNQHGVWSREIAELPLSKVQDVTVEQKGVFATIFGYGKIQVQSAGEKIEFEFEGLPKPNQMSKKILELVQADQRWHREALAQEIKGE